MCQAEREEMLQKIAVLQWMFQHQEGRIYKLEYRLTQHDKSREDLTKRITTHEKWIKGKARKESARSRPLGSTAKGKGTRKTTPVSMLTRAFGSSQKGSSTPKPPPVSAGECVTKAAVLDSEVAAAPPHQCSVSANPRHGTSAFPPQTKLIVYFGADGADSEEQPKVDLESVSESEKQVDANTPEATEPTTVVPSVAAAQQKEPQLDDSSSSSSKDACQNSRIQSTQQIDLR